MTHRVKTPVVLRDGTHALIRPVLPTDAPALVEGFAALSPESRASRFLAPLSRLSPEQVAYFTEVDGKDHVALGAAVPDPRHPHGERGLGVARWVRLAEVADLAEIAVTVRDDAQGLGVGSLLLEALALDAWDHGVRRFLATMHEDNARMRALLRRVGDEERREVEAGGVVTIVYRVRPPAPAPRQPGPPPRPRRSEPPRGAL
ncbi:MAG: GNAT family N-acetyltransferase [Myxococcota bacterium]